MSTLSIGLLNQLGDAFEAAKYTDDDITKLRSDVPRLRELRSVLVGRGQIVVTGGAKVIVKYLVDLDADPFVPHGWEVEEHIKGGQFEWDPAKVTLYLSESQQGGNVIRHGDQLREELGGKRPYNANLLDYLLVNPKLIPEEWQRKTVVFWGTIYRTNVGRIGNLLAVRYLVRIKGMMEWRFRWLNDRSFTERRPAAIPT